jgi:hypothetical protein
MAQQKLLAHKIGMQLIGSNGSSVGSQKGARWLSSKHVYIFGRRLISWEGSGANYYAQKPMGLIKTGDLISEVQYMAGRPKNNVGNLIN